MAASEKHERPVRGDRVGAVPRLPAVVADDLPRIAGEGGEFGGNRDIRAGLDGFDDLCPRRLDGEEAVGGGVDRDLAGLVPLRVIGIFHPEPDHVPVAHPVLHVPLHEEGRERGVGFIFHDHVGIRVIGDLRAQGGLPVGPDFVIFPVEGPVGVSPFYRFGVFKLGHDVIDNRSSDLEPGRSIDVGIALRHGDHGPEIVEEL